MTTRGPEFVGTLAVLDIDRTIDGAEPRVFGGRLVAVYAVDHPAAYERAHEHARNVGGLIVTLGTAVDYRPTAATTESGH